MNLDYMIKHRPRGKYDKSGKATKQDWVLHLIKSQPSDMSMIRAFAGVSESSAKTMINTLRREGHNIKLESYQGFYTYEGLKNDNVD